MWGQALLRKSSPAQYQIIPTRVGTSYMATSCRQRNWDHPHACGDKKSCKQKPTPNNGSSPRVWGQVLLDLSTICGIRIIPTRVGTRDWRQRTALYQRDHPHACGDKLPKNNKLYTYPGSSPRVWGQAEYSVDAFNRLGIIPTRVGTSGFYISIVDTGQDHPHACGDKHIQAFLLPSL